MVIFSECPECHQSSTVTHSSDVYLLQGKHKHGIPVKCPHCKEEYKIIIKVKTKGHQEYHTS